jgi:DNA-binding NarL/FixJ family response regulator
MKVLIADDQPKVRSALRLLLEQEEGLSVSDEAGDSQELIAALERACPDLVLLDWELPYYDGKELVPALKMKYPALSIVALSSNPAARREALDYGADGFVSKMNPPQQVIEFVKRLARV